MLGRIMGCQRSVDVEMHYVYSCLQHNHEKSLMVTEIFHGNSDSMLNFQNESSRIQDCHAVKPSDLETVIPNIRDT